MAYFEKLLKIEFSIFLDDENFESSLKFGSKFFPFENLKNSIFDDKIVLSSDDLNFVRLWQEGRTTKEFHDGKYFEESACRSIFKIFNPK